jgi:hypothetical protein
MRNRGSARRLHRRQPVARKPGSAQPAPTVPGGGFGSVAHLVAKDPGCLLGMSRGGGDRRTVHPRDAQEGVSQVRCWRQQRHDGAAVGWPPPVRSAPRRPVTRAQTTQICFQAPRPPLPVRLLVNRCGSRRSSGDTHRTMLTATAQLSDASEITDTEEVTGSNPVSPTSKFPSGSLFPVLGGDLVPAKCPLQ